MNKYTFRVKNDDAEILSVLSSLQGKERGDFIREAIKFYIKNKDTAEQISNSIQEIQETVNALSKDVAEIREMIKKLSAGTQTNTEAEDFAAERPDKNGRRKNNEKILKELVNDFLNL
ncbi:hypothetical protein SAMN04244560_00106 [Thermoanaerobacter thermohydrosulfuricus]|uniref:Ribbon-helix-helix protein, copG family n=1 Tax=Thermoanaerobacter thermohydrosulfuricus TaxID=1516 RepID=A0A1I1X1A7_THETY|nr:hypothetical protein [Thermoanaerobacter thermohydrosulfuricus]SDF01710.1 hypothetical protein SAMN04244560_00106 [Thermoanaerobacter thermohydrosulfuricus]SFE01205.1 hypothetical protein SAMN04324257_00184 [Thermoanaerobacter thermohydrosulfuricus]